MGQIRERNKGRFFKIGFYIVSGLLLALILLLIIGAMRLFADGGGEPLPPDAGSRGDANELLSFQLNREQTNVLLADLMNGDEDLPFAFHLQEDGVYLTGELDVVFSTIDLSMSFNPEVRDDGSLLLQAESLTAGTASISAEYALRMFNQFADLPDWISLYADEETALLDLNEFEEIEPYGVRFKSVDLEEDHIELALFRKEENATAN